MLRELRLAQDGAADALLTRSPLALLIGLLLDQQVPIEWAFTGPLTITRRTGCDLDAHDLAARDPDAFGALLSERPAVHRYPGSMAKRIQQLCQHLVEQYDGDAAALWRDVPTGTELLRRIQRLPGYGKQKSQILLALLGKQLGVRPPGWREACAPYGEDGAFLSVADIVDPDSLDRVRAAKRAAKAASK